MTDAATDSYIGISPGCNADTINNIFSLEDLVQTGLLLEIRAMREYAFLRELPT